jgi:hypothetical protein
MERIQYEVTTAKGVPIITMETQADAEAWVERQGRLYPGLRIERVTYPAPVRQAVWEDRRGKRAAA